MKGVQVGESFLLLARMKNESVAPPNVDEVINGFQIKERLAETLQSYVFKVQRVSDGKELALKMIKPREEHRAHVENELEIMRDLSSPFVIHAVDFFDYGEFKCMVLPLSQGALDPKKTYPEETVKKIIRSGLLALRYLHKRGIWHRDVKVENFLIFDHDKYVLSDFGLAKKVTEEKMSSDFVGTLRYAAPEVITNKEYDKTIDIWSLGVTMYTLLSGNCPFPITPECTLRRCIETAAYLYPSRFGWRNVSKEAKQLIDRMIVKDPHSRITVDEALVHPWLGGPTTITPKIRETGQSSIFP